MYPIITLDDGRTFTHLAQIFDRGLNVAGSDAPYIGHRPRISTDPLKFANHFVWSTWGQVAKRRLNVGSGVENLFRSGDAVKANGLETVGLWSANTPGEFAFHMSLSIALAPFLPLCHIDAPLRAPDSPSLSLQNGVYSTSPSHCTERLLCLCTKTLARIQLVRPLYLLVHD